MFPFQQKPVERPGLAADVTGRGGRVLSIRIRLWVIYFRPIFKSLKERNGKGRPNFRKEGSLTSPGHSQANSSVAFCRAAYV